jgi:hypothetical protein
VRTGRGRKKGERGEDREREDMGREGEEEANKKTGRRIFFLFPSG